MTNDHKQSSSIGNFLLDILAGSVSSSIAKSTVAPFERVKILLQTLPTSSHDLTRSPYLHVYDIVKSQVSLMSFYHVN